MRGRAIRGLERPQLHRVEAAIARLESSSAIEQIRFGCLLDALRSERATLLGKHDRAARTAGAPTA
jgi:hypothetical protein